MAVDHIRYDILAQEALRGMVRGVLADAAVKGLPGEHHFVITFDTQTAGVRLPPRLMSQFPSEMTIVLQHQFWDLVVTDERFEVGLAFKGVTERLSIPFAAIKSFVDPSVQFGLQFAVETSEDAAQEDGSGGDQAGRSSADAAPVDGGAKETAALPAPAEAASDTGGAEVVRLDRFRKK